MVAFSSAVRLTPVTVWLLVSLGNGGPDYFWPMWLAVPGAVLAVVTRALHGFRNGRGQPPR